MSRNAARDKVEIEDMLCVILGIRSYLWLRFVEISCSSWWAASYQLRKQDGETAKMYANGRSLSVLIVTRYENVLRVLGLNTWWACTNDVS